jgi:hypothetical protein
LYIAASEEEPMVTTSVHSARNRVVVLGVVLAVATACGSGSTANPAATATAHGAFLKAVDNVCARAVAAHAGHTFPLSNFDPEHPDPGQLPTVGNYFSRYGGLPQTTAALHGLTPPASDAGAWRRLLAIADQLRDNGQRQITDARARHVMAFVTTVHAAQRLTNQLDSEGARFGFTSTSACGQVFG